MIISARQIMAGILLVIFLGLQLWAAFTHLWSPLFEELSTFKLVASSFILICDAILIFCTLLVVGLYLYDENPKINLSRRKFPKARAIK